MARCLLVSNRLPLSYNEKENIFVPSSGGLVSAIQGLDSDKVGYDFEWFGVMTDDVADKLEQFSIGKIPCHPIFAPKKTYDEHYNKYCNDVLWPLFHYERSMVHHSQKGWKSYQVINKLIADKIVEVAKDDDTIWIHDFQLLLVPGMIKSQRPHLKVSFFLHIPFPSSEIFRELPQRKEILESLVTCDLIGFHDLSYLNHFKSSLLRIIGYSASIHEERKWGIYPISIDVEHFVKLAAEEKTLETIKTYSQAKGNKKWILGVDRLDYTKGLILKLRAYREFLRQFPDEVGKVQFVQVVIPSRTEVPEYKRLKDAIEQLVSSINGEFGTPTYTPVNYLYHSVSPHELSALYQCSEVLHIGSRRDGMNLVSLEYVVSSSEKVAGSILLTEFAGAHSTLSYALSINPWNIDDTAKKMKEALDRPFERRQKEMSFMKAFLHNYTASDWARFILRDLYQTTPDKEIEVISKDGDFPWIKEIENKKILFFCDLDGTLLSIKNTPDEVTIPLKTEALVRRLSSQENCDFVVVSGRDRDFLHERFVKENYNLTLAACHGAYAYLPKFHDWMNLVPHDSTKWKETVLDIFKMYTIRTPGSFIEDKGHAVTWHYRNSPQGFADFLSNKLFIELDEALSSSPVQVNRGKKVIEVKSIHANKGVFVQNWISQLSPENRPDVIIALGDDTTDEDMFETLTQQHEFPAYCIKVGEENSIAKNFIPLQKNVTHFLEKFLS